MPALVNSSVGSFCGTSDEECTSRCPFCTKKSRNLRRLSEPVGMRLAGINPLYACGFYFDSSIGESAWPIAAIARMFIGHRRWTRRRRRFQASLRDAGLVVRLQAHDTRMGCLRGWLILNLCLRCFV